MHTISSKTFSKLWLWYPPLISCGVMLNWLDACNLINFFSNAKEGKKLVIKFMYNSENQINGFKKWKISSPWSVSGFCKSITL